MDKKMKRKLKEFCAFLVFSAVIIAVSASVYYLNKGVSTEKHQKNDANFQIFIRSVSQKYNVEYFGEDVDDKYGICYRNFWFHNRTTGTIVRVYTEINGYEETKKWIPKHVEVYKGRLEKVNWTIEYPN